MARPSLKEQRRTEILDAMERCVARYGVEGATLEHIAKQAGVKRPALRHFVGNRDDLVRAFSDRFFARAADQNAALRASLEQGLTLDALLDTLFDAAASDAQLVLVTEALIAASAVDRRIGKRMSKFINEFTDIVAGSLQREFPLADRSACHDVAVGIVGIYFNIESMTPLGPIDGLRQASERAVRRLAGTLAEE